MLRIGSSDPELAGPLESSAPPATPDGWFLTDHVPPDEPEHGLPVTTIEGWSLDEVRSRLADRTGLIGIRTAVEGFPTLGDVGLLAREFDCVVPVLDWASVGGVAQSVEGCRAIVGFVQKEFPPDRIQPIRTRFTTDTAPGLEALAGACDIEGVDLVLILDGPSAQALESINESGGRRLGTGAVNAEPVSVVPDGDRWVADISTQPLRLSNIDKPFFPDGTTKGDLIEYYARMAETLLPHLDRRPISMSRYPNGIGGASFYEKRSPGHQPDWMQTAEVDSESMGGRIDFLLAADRESLMWFANMGCIEIHPFHSRADSLDHPDYAIFDLDPADGSTWSQVETATTMVKTMLDALGLVGYPKLSGSKGMHVYVPLAPAIHDHARVRRFVTAVGDLMAKANPSDITVDWKIPNRKGKVFVDANRNAFGQTIASVYSVRPRPGAPVSVPITWDEVSMLKNGDFTMANTIERIRDVGDLFEPVNDGQQVLDDAEARLEIG